MSLIGLMWRSFETGARFYRCFQHLVEAVVSVSAVTTSLKSVIELTNSEQRIEVLHHA